MRDYKRLKLHLPALVFMALLAALSIGVAMRTWLAFPNGLV
jgi:hypothetical protein